MTLKTFAETVIEHYCQLLLKKKNGESLAKIGNDLVSIEIKFTNMQSFDICVYRERYTRSSELLQIPNVPIWKPVRCFSLSLADFHDEDEYPSIISLNRFTTTQKHPNDKLWVDAINFTKCEYETFNERDILNRINEKMSNAATLSDYGKYVKDMAQLYSLIKEGENN